MADPVILALAGRGAVVAMQTGRTGVVTERAPPARPALAPPAHRVAPPAVLALAHLAAVLPVAPLQTLQTAELPPPAGAAAAATRDRVAARSVAAGTLRTAVWSPHARRAD